MAASKKELWEFLVAHSREDLATWILGVSASSTDFKQRLEFYAGTHRSPAAAMAASREAVKEFNALIRARRALKPAEIVKPTLFLLEALDACVAHGYREDILELIQAAMQALDSLIAKVSTRNSRLDTLQQEFAVLHLRAAVILQPDPVQLAERIYSLSETAIGDIFGATLTPYAELLGAAGLARFRELLQPTFQIVVNNPESAPRPRREQRLFLNRRKMLFEWAMVTQNVDEQVSILVSMAKQPGEILTLAGFLEAQQRPMDALSAVSNAYARRPSPELAKYLAERYEAQGQPAEAIPYRWYRFELEPDIEEYDALLATAALATQAKAWSERAFHFAEVHAHRLHVELLMRAERVGEALAAARANGAPIQTWSRLAALHEATDPHTAIGLYFDCADFAIQELRRPETSAPSGFIANAWHLASDTSTFQTFNARLRSLFASEEVPRDLGGQLEAAGIPVGKLLR